MCTGKDIVMVWDVNKELVCPLMQAYTGGAENTNFIFCRCCSEHSMHKQAENNS